MEHQSTRKPPTLNILEESSCSKKYGHSSQRRKSVCVFSSTSPNSAQNKPRLNLDISEANELGKPIGNPLTTRLPIDGSPKDKKVIEEAIEEIKAEEDPEEQARKSTLLIVNLQIMHAQEMLARVTQTSEQTQRTLTQLEEGLDETRHAQQEMHQSQKKLRKMAYISFCFGICGLTLFSINYFNKLLQDDK